MKTKQVLITTGGVLYLLFSALHLSFWKLFDWGSSLANIGEVNRSVLQLLNIGLIVLLFSLGIILLIHRKSILTTNLGKSILLASSAFFLVRFVMDFIFPGGSIFLKTTLFISTLIYLIPALLKPHNNKIENR